MFTKLITITVATFATLFVSAACGTSAQAEPATAPVSDPYAGFDATDRGFLTGMDGVAGGDQAKSQRLPASGRILLARAMCTDLGNGTTSAGQMLTYMHRTQGDPWLYVQVNLTAATVAYCPAQTDQVVAAVMTEINSGAGVVTAPTRATVTSAPAQGLPPGQFSDGTYLVGTDMPVGTYVTDGSGSDTASGSCYWSRNKNDAGSAGNVIKNNYGSGPGRFSAKAGEVVILQHGCTWHKAG